VNFLSFTTGGEILYNIPKRARGNLNTSTTLGMAFEKERKRESRQYFEVLPLARYQ
jgi:hypothetical protein